MKKILKIIEKNFNLSKKDIPKGLYSKHWDVFSKNFKESFNSINFWKNFLHNEEGNISIRKYGKEMDANINQTRNLKKEKVKINDYIKNDLVRRFNLLKKKVGIEFIRKNSEGKIGNPKAFYYKKLNLTAHDISYIYYAWRIGKIKKFIGKNPVFLEIGAGAGHLSAKLKKNFPDSKIIIIDLPEVNCLQRIYHWNASPKAKIFDYVNYKKKGLKFFFKNKYDYAILPAWVIKNIPNKSLDLVINTQSFQEMNSMTVKNYMQHINRITKINGFFYCLNRYVKDDSDKPIKIKDFQFDEHWYFNISKEFFLQEWVHELLAVRTNLKNFYSSSKVLNKLHPVGFRNIILNIKEIFLILKNLLYTKDHRIYPYSLNIFVLGLFKPLRTFLKIRTRIKKVFNFFSK